MNLRQDLVVQVLLLLFGLLSFVSCVTSIRLVALDLADHSRPGFWYWWIASNVGPLLAFCLLPSSYRIPWLGPVWRYADEVWMNSGLEVPSDSRWRCQGRRPSMHKEAARTSLLEAVARTRRLHYLTLCVWIIGPGVCAGAVFWVMHR